MKKIIHILIVAAIIASGYYLYLYWALGNDSVEQPVTQEYFTYSESDIGLEFDYRQRPNGYVVNQRMLVDLGTGLIKNIILIRTEDTILESPEGGEGPPVINISVFENIKKQVPRAWADENTQYSNINLMMGEVDESILAGAHAIRYMADGLYTSENAVVAHGDHMYVIRGQFLDQDSPIRLDYRALVESIRFIPAPVQN